MKAQKEAIQRAQLDMVTTMRKEKELAALNPITRFRRSDPLAFWVTAALLLVLAMYAVVTLL